MNTVVHLNLTKFLISKFKEFMSYVLEFSRYPTLPVPVRWGVEHEQNALVDYLALQNAVTSLRLEESGLTINPSHAFLGATSDGWVYDESMPEGNQKGVLEIKCPYSISNDVITHREVHFFITVNVNVFIINFFCFYESINSIYEQYIYLLFNRFTSW